MEPAYSCKFGVASQYSSLSKLLIGKMEAKIQRLPGGRVDADCDGVVIRNSIADLYLLQTRAGDDRLIVLHLDITHIDQGAQIIRVNRAKLQSLPPDVPQRPTQADGIVQSEARQTLLWFAHFPFAFSPSASAGRHQTTSYSRFNRSAITSQKACRSALFGTGPASTPNISSEFQGFSPYTVTFRPRCGQPSIWLKSWRII